MSDIIQQALDVTVQDEEGNLEEDVSEQTENSNSYRMFIPVKRIYLSHNGFYVLMSYTV